MPKVMRRYIVPYRIILQQVVGTKTDGINGWSLACPAWPTDFSDKTAKRAAHANDPN